MVEEYDISVNRRAVHPALGVPRITALAGGVRADHLVVAEVLQQHAVRPLLSHPEVVAVVVEHPVLEPVEVAEVMPASASPGPRTRRASPRSLGSSGSATGAGSAPDRRSWRSPDPFSSASTGR